MRRIFSLLFALAASLPATATSPSLSLSTDYTSAYVFRGVQLAGQSVQPTAELTYGPVYATASLTQPLRRSEAREVDYSVGLSGESGVDLGVNAYTYPEGGKTTWEPYLGLAAEKGRTKLSVYGLYDATLHVTTFEGAAMVRLLSFGGIDLAAEGAFGTSQGRGLPRYSYWSAGPAVRYRVTERLSATFASHYHSSDDAALKRDLWVTRVGVGMSF